MKLAKQQLEALEIAHKRIAAGEPITRVFGYAGTGKTTIAKELARTSDRVLFAAFTGKAASVLTRKGCPASTIHGLIYQPTGNYGERIEKLKKQIAEFDAAAAEGGDNSYVDVEEYSKLRKELAEARRKAKQPGFKFEPEASPLNEADLLVLDEVSMVDDKIAEDLLSFDVPILALGDPAQLPPVGKGGYFTNGGEKAADALLTEVHRQAADGDVIDLATLIRSTRIRPDVNGSTVVKSIKRSAALDFDQVLVGTNKTRWTKNRTLRKLLGHGVELLYPNERIICLSNSKGLGVLNGQQFVILELRDSAKENVVEALLACECEGAASTEESCHICSWIPRWIPMWTLAFEGVTGETELKEMPYQKSALAMHATYGYAITVHKSQGSEWNRVLVVDESLIFRKQGWRWLYTAVTRAANEVVVLRG